MDGKIYYSKVEAIEKFKKKMKSKKRMQEIPRESHSIQFYYKPEEPQSLDSLVGVTEGKFFSG